MSIRHFLAELDSAQAEKALYRFTPDSIKKLYWGKVEFDLNTFAYEIVESAPAAGQELWSEDQACECLARKLKKHYESSHNSPPRLLEWAS